MQPACCFLNACSVWTPPDVILRRASFFERMAEKFGFEGVVWDKAILNESNRYIRSKFRRQRVRIVQELPDVAANFIGIDSTLCWMRSSLRFRCHDLAIGGHER